MTWFVTQTSERGLGKAESFPTKRAALKFITSLGELSSISRSVVPGGRSYVVSVKKK